MASFANHTNEAFSDEGSSSSQGQEEMSSDDDESVSSSMTPLLVFVPSVNTLGDGQVLPVVRMDDPGNCWRDRPPFLTSMSRKRNKLRQRRLFLRACKRGVPPALRCAVWVASVSGYYGSARHDDASKESLLYGTQVKARAIQSEWQRIVGNTATTTAAINTMPTCLFGADREQLLFFMENKSSRDWMASKFTATGMHSMNQVLGAVSYSTGITYCPILPYVTALLLTHMPPPYAHWCICEMVTDAHSYMPTTLIQCYQWHKTFVTILERMFPKTFQEMEHLEITTSTNGLAPIFQKFFVDLFPRQFVLRIMDIYTTCGSGMETIFRFGIALISLVKSRTKGSRNSASEWWDAVRDVTFSPAFTFDTLLARAYQNIGGRFHKSIRFPKSRILIRLIRTNEPWAHDHALTIHNNTSAEDATIAIEPLHAVVTQNNNLNNNIHIIDEECLLANQPQVQNSPISSWLPPTLRETKLDLLYSTSVHGRTIENLYRCCSKTKRTIMLMEVACAPTAPIIGVYATQPWHMDSQVYGDGNCFVFRVSPNPKCYTWSPPPSTNYDPTLENNKVNMETLTLWDQFMVGRRTFLAVGANKDGGSALRLNEDLSRGESSPALGYNNEPLAGNGRVDFEVNKVEVYRFIRKFDGLPSDPVNNVWKFN